MLWLGGMFTREGAGVTPLRLQTDTGSRPAGLHATAVV